MYNSTSDLPDRARVYATEAHQRINHRRKYNNEPYDVHLSAVAKLVASATDDEEMIAAGWLHDTVEDTEATLEAVERVCENRSDSTQKQVPNEL